jgi:hypothetical protein
MAAPRAVPQPGCYHQRFDEASLALSRVSGPGDAQANVEDFDTFIQYGSLHAPLWFTCDESVSRSPINSPPPPREAAAQRLREDRPRLINPAPRCPPNQSMAAPNSPSSPVTSSG